MVPDRYNAFGRGLGGAPKGREAVGRLFGCLFAAMLLTVLLVAGDVPILAQQPVDVSEESQQDGPEPADSPAGPRTASAGDSIGYSFRGRTFQYDQSRVTFEKNLLDVARISDPGTIQVFKEEFFWEDTLITEISIIDLDGDGFDEDDWILRQPSELAGRIATITDRISSIMAEWNIPKAREYYLENSSQVDLALEALGGLSGRASELQQCQYCLIRSLLFGLSNVYFDDPLRFYFERNPEGLIKAEIWDYDEAAFHFTGCKAMSDTIPIYDVIKVTRRDTMLVAERNFFDLIYVSNTNAETLYVEPPGFDIRRAQEAQ